MTGSASGLWRGALWLGLLAATACSKPVDVSKLPAAPTPTDVALEMTERPRYRIGCPSQWELRREPDVDFVCVDDKSTHGANCNVVFEETRLELDAKLYWEANELNMRQHNLSILQDTHVNVGGREAYRVRYNHDNADYTALAYLYALGETGFVVTCTVGSRGFADVEGIFDAVGQSFVAKAAGK